MPQIYTDNNAMPNNKLLITINNYLIRAKPNNAFRPITTNNPITAHLPLPAVDKCGRQGAK